MPNQAIAGPARSGGLISSSKTWLSGTRLAPKAPCRKRNTTSISMFAAMPQPSEVSVKPATDSAMMRMRPKRSASQPDSGVAIAAATR